MGGSTRALGRRARGACLSVYCLQVLPLLRPKNEAERWKPEEGTRGLGKLLWRADKPPKETHCRGHVKSSLGELSSSWDFREGSDLYTSLDSSDLD